MNIFRAIKNNNYERVETLLKENSINAHMLNNFKQTPLYYACYLNRFKIVLLLIQYDVDINNGVNVNVKKTGGMTPLHISCKNNNEKIIDLLLKNGANVNSKTKYGYTPLHMSCENDKKNIKIIEMLLKNGANPNIQNEFSVLPIDFCIKYTYPRLEKDIVDLLLNYGANIQLETILHYKPHYGKRTEKEDETLFEIIEKIYNNTNTLHINVQCKYGMTALNTACDHNSYKIVNFLIEKGANVNIPNNNGNSPLHTICKKRIDKIEYNIIELLLQKGADVNAQNNDGQTPLHLIMEYCPQYMMIKCVQLLLQFNANIHLKTKEGRSIYCKEPLFQLTGSTIQELRSIIINQETWNCWNSYEGQYKFYLEWIPKEIMDDLMEYLNKIMYQRVVRDTYPSYNYSSNVRFASFLSPVSYF